MLQVDEPAGVCPAMLYLRIVKSRQAVHSFQPLRCRDASVGTLHISNVNKTCNEWRSYPAWQRDGTDDRDMQWRIILHLDALQHCWHAHRTFKRSWFCSYKRRDDIWRMIFTSAFYSLTILSNINLSALHVLRARYRVIW